uniref:Conserved hypothetical plastid protein n=1 Tax=Bangiopsis subsimplex TaxID=139980 RepID=A0A1C9CCL2_9RHOD|nr:hypothetical protein Bangp_010 [Bangiopsis subsimplex]AOM66092.1 hypothetical protein Bangp_010 [Bangiopsis subsimplex]ARO90352.1 conserved hypothetical plastid protein [Bangiopsis subsimplex]
MDKEVYGYEDSHYISICLDQKKCIIRVFYVNIIENYYDIFNGCSARELSTQILLKYNFNRFHAIYLGRELMKAEIALALNQIYIQS